MPIYKIAKVNVLINPLCKENLKLLQNYKTNESNIDFAIYTTKDEIVKEYNLLGKKYSYASVESSLILKKFSENIIDNYNGFLFHSSSIMYNNDALMFTAKSGVGKSTHTRLWREHFKNDVVMINDDKPIIRKIDGIFYSFGTPWMGKANIGNNIFAPIKAVYVISRGENNSITLSNTNKVIKQLFEATTFSSNQFRMSKLLELLNQFLSQTKIFELCCTVSDEAVQIAHKAYIENCKGNV